MIAFQPRWSQATWRTTFWNGPGYRVQRSVVMPRFAKEIFDLSWLKFIYSWRFTHYSSRKKKVLIVDSSVFFLCLVDLDSLRFVEIMYKITHVTTKAYDRSNMNLPTPGGRPLDHPHQRGKPHPTSHAMRQSAYDELPASPGWDQGLVQKVEGSEGGPQVWCLHWSSGANFGWLLKGDIGYPLGN